MGIADRQLRLEGRFLGQGEPVITSVWHKDTSVVGWRGPHSVHGRRFSSDDMPRWGIGLPRGGAQHTKKPCATQSSMRERGKEKKPSYSRALSSESARQGKGDALRLGAGRDKQGYVHCSVYEQHAQRSEATGAWACCQCERYHRQSMLTNALALAPVFSPEAEMPSCLSDHVCRDFLRHFVSRQLYKSLCPTDQTCPSTPVLPSAPSLLFMV
jgi:hypothetical protein